MRHALALTCGLVLIVSACAKRVPVPVVSSPKFPDFVMPTVPAEYAASPAAASQDRAWIFLQAGNLKDATRELTAALKATPGFFPAETALGYVELADKNAKAGLTHFDRALQQQAGYAPALVGRGEALLSLNRDADAIAAFQAAATADPLLVDLPRRIEVLKFRGLQQNLALARQAAQAGKIDDAIRAYTGALASSPDTPFLYRELAVVENQKGDTDAALEHLRKAVALEPGDAASLEGIGDILERRNDMEGASAAYASANAVEPSAALESKIEAISARADLARLPAEYRAIGENALITRADLAALIGVRLAPLLQNRRSDAVLITDVRSSWALPWIMAVARAGVMEPFDNHAFQPRTIVRRSELAQAVARLLSRIAESDPRHPKAWDSARGKFSDLSPGHLAYPAASASVAAGVLSVDPGSAFQPSRPVTGAEAVDAVSKLEALAGQSPRGNGRQ